MIVKCLCGIAFFIDFFFVFKFQGIIGTSQCLLQEDLASKYHFSLDKALSKCQ